MIRMRDNNPLCVKISDVRKKKKNSFVENFRSEFLKLINVSRFTTFPAPDRGLSIGPSNVQKSAVKVKSDVASLHDLPMRSVKLEIQIVRKLGARRLLRFFLFHIKDDECLILYGTRCTACEYTDRSSAL